MYTEELSGIFALGATNGTWFMLNSLALGHREAEVLMAKTTRESHQEDPPLNSQDLLGMLETQQETQLEMILESQTNSAGKEISSQLVCA